MTEPIRRAKRVEITTLVGVCARCGEEFTPEPSNKVYCRTTCRTAAWKAEHEREPGDDGNASGSKNVPCTTLNDGSNHRGERNGGNGEDGQADAL